MVTDVTATAAGSGSVDAEQEAAALVDSLAQSAFLVMEALTRIGAQHDLSLTQMRVLGILRDRRPRMAQLAAHLGLERSTLSGLIDRAESRGIVSRGRSADDGRAIEVYMTPEGLALADVVHKKVRRALAPSTDRLDRGQRRRLNSLLEKMVEGGPPLAPDR